VKLLMTTTASKHQSNLKCHDRGNWTGNGTERGENITLPVQATCSAEK